MTPRVVLVGPMGVGKTTVARILAERWGVEARDTDDVVESRAGKPISDIFVDDGEEQFRALEREVVAASLEDCDGVLALGGGAVLAEETRRLLEAHPVVFLDVGFADALKRVGLGVGRPLLMGNVRAQLRELLEHRRPVYLDVCDHVVATDGLDAHAVADAVAGWTESLGEDW